MRRQLSLGSVLALLFALTISGAARANVTLGSTAQPPGSTPEYCQGAVVAQVASDPSTPYTVPSKGSISSWQINTVGGLPGAPVTLVVLRQTSGSNYTVVGADSRSLPNPLPATAAFSIASPIAVNGAELLAVYAPPGSRAVCFFHDGST